MMGHKRVGNTFREGDEVVLAEGTYQGTLGVFVRFRKDANWADIKERNGSIRSHPVAWLDQPVGASPRLPGLTPAGRKRFENQVESQ